MNTHKNPLYPIFLKLDRLQFLIVGAGEVGFEKLSFLLKSSPNARITIVAPWVSNDVARLIYEYEDQIQLEKRPFHHTDVIDHNIRIYRSVL